MKIKINNKVINIYYDENKEKVPVIILNSFEENIEKIIDLTKKLNTKKWFIFFN